MNLPLTAHAVVLEAIYVYAREGDVRAIHQSIRTLGFEPGGWARVTVLRVGEGE